MAVQTYEIKSALDRIDVSTARGRAELDGRAISVAPSDEKIAEAAVCRRDAYLGVIRDLRKIVEENACGIDGDEIEAAELIRELLIDLYKRADGVVRSRSY